MRMRSLTGVSKPSCFVPAAAAPLCRRDSGSPPSSGRNSIFSAFGKNDSGSAPGELRNSYELDGAAARGVYFWCQPGKWKHAESELKV